MKKTPTQSNKIYNYFKRTPTSTDRKSESTVKREESSPTKKSDESLTKSQKNDSTPKKSRTSPRKRAGESPEKKNATALQTVNRSPKNSAPKASETPKSNKRPNTSDSSNKGFQLFDIVMAKLEGYPPWPSMICEDPEKGSYVSNFKYHVQFFDEYWSHAWILKRDVKDFSDNAKIASLSRIKDSKLREAHKMAISAYEMDREERVKLLNHLEGDQDSKESIEQDQDESKDKDSDFEMDVDSGESESGESSGVEESEPETEPESDDETPKKKRKQNDHKRKLDFDSSPEESKNTPAKRPRTGGANKSVISTPTSSSTSTAAPVGSMAVNHIEAADRQWPHLKLPFLQPENIRDAKNQRMIINEEINPEYDFTTLYVPSTFLQTLTPAMRQWWEFKRDNFDTILFFKMGKFYECFHMDAVIATKELQILFMRGEYAHAGFPEKSFKRYADALIQRGYKVARIEQTETPDMMEERVKKIHKPTKFDRVVRRELCRISSLGTRIMSDIDSDAFLPSNAYLFAISCRELDNLKFLFGVSFVDVSIGKFHITQFQDDQHFSTLRTMLVHHSPSEILFPGSNKQLSKLIDNVFPNVRKQPCKKFRSSGDTLKFIHKGKYWDDMPEDFLDKIIDKDDNLRQTCTEAYELGMNSLGGIIDYLERGLIADDILSMKSFELYSPPEKASDQVVLGSNMILDSSAMKHLEILENLNGGESKNLIKIIDKCVTPFGKRLFRGWVCMPLCGRKEELLARQQAVRELAENSTFLAKSKSICGQLQKLPDLERLLMQIHSQSSLKRSKEHPDSRAILFDDHIYRKRKIGNFLLTLDGFETILEIVNGLQDFLGDLDSELLKRLLCFEGEDIGRFPQCKEMIDFFRNSFDADTAKKEGNIIPKKGADQEYDDALEAFDEANRALEKYLKDQSKFFNARCSYFGTGKNRYQLEIPDTCVKKAMECKDDHYELKSTRKGFKRYHTNRLLELIADFDKAQENKALALRDIFRRLLEKFDQNYDKWSRAIQSIAAFDALISLSKTKQIFEFNSSSSCIPEFVWDGPSIFIANELRNATLIDTRALIPNDVKLENQTLVLTGPNMAGKTTLMRSIGLAAVLAQIGAYVPASYCKISPVDRIFTRIGAYDQAMEAQSTFMVELNEAALIVNRSTKASLVLVDELGRGTSTFDGIAIAHAVLNELSQNIRCRTIFSTHFHSIVDDIQALEYPVKVGHMAYIVENTDKDHPTEEDVIFLYKLTDGVCSQSYGYNVAKMAGIPSSILRSSYKAGRAFELQVESCRLLNAFIEMKKEDKTATMDDDKLDKLADYLSELLITRTNSGTKDL